ncbi:MAG TPA: methylated-DNA--[protein]-cysteine S-methyltransferase [Candidatus Syntrophosphaera sp.]|nr:methylated-DNA--[protein]-cysteine S-methyltransferase [Candidatus Syntrophosphaera sp.]
MNNTKIKTAYYVYGSFRLRLTLEEGALASLDFARSAKTTEIISPEMAAVFTQLDEYFSGSRKNFTVKLKLRGTPFQIDVWNALRKIPYGETRTYKEIATQIGRPQAFRAVGQAIHNNPIAIVVPCHRVIGSDGSLTGFAGGLELKKRLLELERKTAGKK